MNRILYKTTEGKIALIIPAGEALQTEGIDIIAARDVPSGLPYKIVDVSQIPSDFTFFEAWEIEESELTDGVGE